MAVAANKSNIYEYEEVEEKEGMAFAKQYNTIFQTITAKDANGGIYLLFKNIGKNILNPIIENTTFLNKEELKKRGEQLKQERIQGDKKSGCC